MNCTYQFIHTNERQQSKDPLALREYPWKRLHKYKGRCKKDEPLKFIARSQTKKFRDVYACVGVCVCVCIAGPRPYNCVRVLAQAYE